jgi:chromosomal replication initiation ATPase DnaA
MKIEVLKEFIKKTVQQEVRNVVQSEIKLQLAEIFSKEVGQNKKKSSESDLEQQILKELETMDDVQVIEEEVKPVKKFVKYTNNPMLNDILNQTTGGVPQEGGLVSMMGGLGGGSTQVIAESKAPANAPEPVKSVYSAMNRDYRSLMKAVNKKRGDK